VDRNHEDPGIRAEAGDGTGGEGAREIDYHYPGGALLEESGGADGYVVEDAAGGRGGGGSLGTRGAGETKTVV
jgi:hypothetical protein